MHVWLGVWMYEWQYWPGAGPSQSGANARAEVDEKRFPGVLIKSLLAASLHYELSIYL